MKLFWGFTLPVLAPEGEHYRPPWTARELATLRRVLRGGVHLMRNALPAAVDSRSAPDQE